MSETKNAALPKWLIPVIVTGLVIVVGAVVAILVIVINGSIVQAEKDAEEEAAAAAEQARLSRLSNAVESCGLSSSFVTVGGRKFEVTTGFGGSATHDDVVCVLEQLDAPEDVIGLQAYAGRPPSSAGWDDFTFTIDYPAFLADSVNTIEMSE